jgi:hypothetical protein
MTKEEIDSKYHGTVTATYEECGIPASRFVKQVCAMCTHAKAFTGDAKFTCRRYPPIPVWMSGESCRDKLVSRWPRVNGDDTCGEWKA